MEKRCILVSAGPVDPKQTIPAEDLDSYVIACDGGWKNCEKLGLVPDLVLGDFDSSERPAGDHVLVLPQEKDDTDTHYAARQAVERGFDRVLMLGALGGLRIEHMMANLGTGLWLEQQGIHTELLNENSRVRFLLPGTEQVWRREGYRYLSVFPMEGRVEGLTITGAKYPLDHAVVDVSFPVGVSNEWQESEIHIKTEKGALLVIETRSDQ